VDRFLGDPALDPAGIDALREVIVATGALEEVERMITADAERALAALDTADVAAPADTVLHELATAATARRS
jgi:geranylgeranyl diphosphate synthase type I